MKIKLFALGKIKTPAFSDMAREYESRIRKYHPFEVVEILDEPIRSKTPRDVLLEKEADKIRKKIKSGSFIIPLDEKGKQYSSVELSWELKQLFESSHREIVFLIGGAEGLAESLKGNAGLVLSLSKLTLPHQLARVLLLEQIYRALTILRNVPYHNG